MKTLYITIIMLAAATLAQADTTCQSTFTMGAGQTTLNFCVTANGNIAQLQAGYYQLLNGSEGYAICPLSGGAYYDTGMVASANWGTSVITQPKGSNTFPLTITRTSTDTYVTLVQSFSYSNGGKSIRVKMTLTSPLHGTLILIRYADVIGTPQMSDHVSRSAFVWNQDAAGLTASPFAVPRVDAAIVFGNSINPCIATGPSTFPYAGDAATLLNWNVDAPRKLSVQFDYVPLW